MGNLLLIIALWTAATMMMNGFALHWFWSIWATKVSAVHPLHQKSAADDRTVIKQAVEDWLIMCSFHIALFALILTRDYLRSEFQVSKDGLSRPTVRQAVAELIDENEKRFCLLAVWLWIWHIGIFVSLVELFGQ